ncbi:MAG: DNA polymerase Y family protein [Candidatus Dojkabacteria bacterium]
MFGQYSGRVICHIDMNAYFASVEQAANPNLVGKPVAVVPTLNYAGAAILARSYEAKDKGVKTFSRLYEAKQVCPELVAVKSDHLKYYQINQELYKIVSRYSPDVEIYSIDEFFLDLTGYYKFREYDFESLAKEIKQAITREIHPALKCSIGFGPNKLLAKVGSDYQKPDGLTVIPWDKRLEYLDSLALEDIWGIGKRSVPKLHALGIDSTKKIRELTIEMLYQQIGSYAYALKRLANGEYYEYVSATRNSKPQKSMQHAHTLSQSTNDQQELLSLMRKLLEKLAKRLRKHGQKAGYLQLYLRPEREQTYGWGYTPSHKISKKLPFTTNNGFYLYQTGLELFNELYDYSFRVRLLAVGVGELVQEDQFEVPHLYGEDLEIDIEKRSRIDSAIDIINRKYGDFTVRSADIINQKAKESRYSVERLPMTFHPD